MLIGVNTFRLLLFDNKIYSVKNMKKQKLAIIGASYLQLPLIEKAKEMGYETHVFAWEAGDVGEQAADFFYPISIVEKELILNKCREIGIVGICSIGSDLAVVTVNYVANMLSLTGNTLHCSLLSTNKHEMRLAFEEHGDPSPKSRLINNEADLDCDSIAFPVIIKPIDRSGSRGVSLVNSFDELAEAIDIAKEVGFDKRVLIEEYVEGAEYSVECLSYRGDHNFLALTKKYTTGIPHFIETAHLEPAPVSDAMVQKIKEVVFHALDSLEIQNSASHSELKISESGDIKIIEIGSRMGGDLIGSSLVYESTGIDFTANVIRIAVGQEPDLGIKQKKRVAAVRFVFSENDINVLRLLENERPYSVLEKDINPLTAGTVKDSSDRFGYYIFAGDNIEDIVRYLPD